MRTERISGISAPCDLLTSFHRKFSRFGNNLYFPAFFFILKFLHPFGNGRNKTTQMAVDRWIAIVIADIKYISRTIRDTNTRNIAISESTNGFTDNSACLKIQSAVEMIGADFSKVPTQCKRKVKRRYKGYLLLLLSIPSDAASQHQSSDISSHHSVHFFTPANVHYSH